MNNKVSIIVPIYNQKDIFIKKCISSLICQTYQNIEIILIDDGSEEVYRNLYKEIAKKDKRIKLYLKNNTGVSDSRNYGINKSTGNYITFVDSDDWLQKNAIEIMVKELIKNKVDIIRTTYYIADDKNSKIRPYNINTGLYNKILIKEKLIPSLITGVENNFVPLLLIKKEILIENKFDKDIGMLEDECFFIRLLLSINRIYLLDVPTYYYYQNNSSKTKSSVYYKKNINDVIEANKKLQKLLRENKLDNLIDNLNQAHSLILLRYLSLVYTELKETTDFLKMVLEQINNNKILANVKKFKVAKHLKIQLWLLKNKYYKLLLIIFKIKNIKFKEGVVKQYEK